MSGPAIPWERITLVAFDVDGTLYAQRPLRLRMAAALVGHTLKSRSRGTMAVLSSYRQMREEIGDAETVDFDRVLIERVAECHSLSTTAVREMVVEWMERRPLAWLSRSRYPAVDRLFERIRRSGRAIGILSDYPAVDKLTALSLQADHVVCAGEVGVLKPHPLGLERLMAMAGATPDQTVLIGDRFERDAAAAHRAGAACLLRTSRPVNGVTTFTRFDDPLFDALDRPAALASNDSIAQVPS